MLPNDAADKAGGVMHRFPHWNHFLVLEADLAAASRYIEFSEDNFKCYSAEFTKILLAGGSETDVVAKAICREIDPSRKYENVDNYRASIAKKYPRFHTLEISIPAFGLCFKPWEAWAQDQNPTWWKATTMSSTIGSRASSKEI